MQYFTRQLYMNAVGAAAVVEEDDEEAGQYLNDDGDPDDAEDNEIQAQANADFEAAEKAYEEQLDEIRDDLPKSIRKLLDDEDWNDAYDLRCVDDRFYLVPAEEISLMIQVQTGTTSPVFILRYTVEEMPKVDSPSEEEQPYFKAEELKVLKNEWSVDDDGVVAHRMLLSNGFIVTFRLKQFRWWKVKVEAEA